EAGVNVTEISQCPTLSPRTPPTSVHDLRADDIKVIGALGDSITAGFGIMGLNTSLPLIAAMSAAFKEYRGLSYSAGGDAGAFTVPNYIKHYQTNLTGYSVGSHLPERCHDLPNKDGLNAAQSGAIARNLDHQLDYLLERIKFVEGVDYGNDWKMINIQIGSNDMCGACNSSYINDTTPEVFGNYVEAAVERIRNGIPKVLVNLVGTFNVSQLFPLRAGQSYCLPSNNTDETLCPCATTPGGLEKIGNLNLAYNQKLVDIYKKYQKNKTDNFTVIYQQSNINITGFPIDFFSNIDCFHPGLKGHQWISKILWNQFFVPQYLKPTVFNFNENETIYCPVDSDRIATN
ncbi:SGNH hydrolase-type esterase domain-containing protein, partial [Helicostylum pulchrum]